MYEVQIINRGPEGIRNFKGFRVTKAASDKLLADGMKNAASPADLLAGIELEETGGQTRAAAPIGGTNPTLPVEERPTARNPKPKA